MRRSREAGPETEPQIDEETLHKWFLEGGSREFFYDSKVLEEAGISHDDATTALKELKAANPEKFEEWKKDVAADTKGEAGPRSFWYDEKEDQAGQ